MQCERHPAAVAHDGHCPGCLLEAALAPGDAPLEGSSPEVTAARPAGLRHLTVCLPLGVSARASVFLVRDASMGPCLLRLKVWHAPAPAGFLKRFHDLQVRLDRLRGEPIAVPLAASLDPDGHPAVLSEFRQGVPLLDSVRAGTTNAATACRALRLAIEAIRAAHSAGLVHGAIVPGNVLVQAESGSTHVLDFGMAALLHPDAGLASVRRTDRDGLAALARAVRGLRPR